MVIGIVIGLIVGLTVGVLAVFAWHTASVSSLRARVEVAERSARTEAQIIESVRAAQAEAMRDSSEMLAELAGQKMQTSTAKVEGTVKPVADQLQQLQRRVDAVERQLENRQHHRAREVAGQVPAKLPPERHGQRS